MPAPVPAPERLRRGIGRADAVALVVGSMIGSGIFIVSAESARLVQSGTGLLAVWAAAGALTLAGALSCAELAAMLPKAGGQYVFFREAYGPLAGFLFGWAMLLVIQTGTIAAVAVAFAKFLGVLVPAVSGRPLLALGPLPLTASPIQLVAIAVIVLLTASNTTGLAAGTLTQNVFTLAKFAALLALAGAGLWLGGGPGTAWSAGSDLRGPGGGLTGLALAAAFGAAMVGPLFSQSAWNNVTFAAEEVEDPGRTLPFALLWGCLAVTVLYLATNAAYLRALPLAEIAHAPEDRVGTAAARALLGPGAAAATAAAIMVSTFGCVNGLILSGARVGFAMARDGLFFRRLARLNAASVPASALWLQAAWASVLVLSGTYSQLLRYVVSADILLYVLLVGAVIVLRRKHPGWPRPFRAPAYPWLQLAYCAAALALTATLLLGGFSSAWPGFAVLAAGVPAYFAWRRRAPAGGA
ncbi:MAG TPA: amino acid permease [Thermoanaerobaculia bacterium]